MAIVLTTDDTRREVFLKAEQAKIQTGSILPTLDNPASIGDVIAGKEYIDGAGAKQEGTLVVCDTVQDDGYFGNNGYGVSVNLVSVLDRSTKILELPEPNLKSENIVSGANIFGIGGSAKTLRVETGSITPAEDITAIDIACTPGYKLFVLQMTNGSAHGKTYWQEIFCTPDISAVPNGTRNANVRIVNASGKVQYGVLSTDVSTGFSVSVSIYVFAAGCEYTWTAYYWEDT